MTQQKERGKMNMKKYIFVVLLVLIGGMAYAFETLDEARQKADRAIEDSQRQLENMRENQKRQSEQARYDMQRDVQNSVVLRDILRQNSRDGHGN